MLNKMLNKKVLAYVSILVLLIALVACKSPKTFEGTWYYCYDDEIFVELDANATTGYEWTVSIDNTRVVSLDEEEYIPHDAPFGMVGVGGTWKCELEAECDGEAVLTFVYARPWDKTDIAKTLILKITVSNDKIINVQEVKEQ